MPPAATTRSLSAALLPAAAVTALHMALHMALLPQQASAALLATPCFDGMNSSYAALRPRQEFTFDTAAGGMAKLVSDPTQCLTALSPGKRGSELTVAACLAAGDKSQSWAPVANATTDGLKLQGGGGSAGLQNGGLTNAVVWLGPGSGAIAADSANPSEPQQLALGAPRPPLVSFQTTTGPSQGVFLVSPSGGFNHATGCGRGCTLCVTYGAPVRPCDQPSPAAAFPMCDSSLPLTQRVADLVARVPAEDVTKLLVNVAGPVPSLWISAQNWWSEALHGVQSGCVTTSGMHSKCPISFPVRSI